MESIGVRELRQPASRWLARVQAGESFEITDRARPVATLSPVAENAWERLVASGHVSDAHGSLTDVTPAEGSSLTDVLLEDLGEER